MCVLPVCLCAPLFSPVPQIGFVACQGGRSKGGAQFAPSPFNPLSVYHLLRRSYSWCAGTLVCPCRGVRRAPACSSMCTHVFGLQLAGRQWGLLYQHVCCGNPRCQASRQLHCLSRCRRFVLHSVQQDSLWDSWVALFCFVWLACVPVLVHAVSPL